MKNQRKSVELRKLDLHKETIIVLTPDRLALAAGGITGIPTQCEGCHTEDASSKVC